MSTQSFEELVESSITETLCKILGPIVWQAIRFYFEPRVLSQDPEALPDVLDKLFGHHGKVLGRVIAEDLLMKVGASEESQRASDFRSFIRIAKAKFISSTSNLARAGSAAL